MPNIPLQRNRASGVCVYTWAEWVGGTCPFLLNSTLLLLHTQITSCQLLSELVYYRTFLQLAVVVRLCLFPQQPAPSFDVCVGRHQIRKFPVWVGFLFFLLMQSHVFQCRDLHWLSAMFFCKELVVFVSAKVVYISMTQIIILSKVEYCIT